MKTIKPISPTAVPLHPWPPPRASMLPPAAPARGAFAAVAALAGPLGRADQRLLEAALFDGHRCTELARSLGVAAADVRRRLGMAMLALHGALTGSAPAASGPGEPDGGAVAAMLALHALDALDPDEAALVDAMLAYQPALQRVHAGYCELVGELCLMVARIEPPPCPVPPGAATAN
jgi:hypothetical protein